MTFRSRITHAFVNGALAWNNGRFAEEPLGMALEFDRSA